MESLIINNKYLHLHPLWSACPSTLKDIANRDYPRKNYFKKLDIDALDLDRYEKSQHKHSMECTGDAVVGIALEKSDNTLLRPAVMIVELRMGYKHGDNISLSELKRKITHTKTLLSTVLPVHPNYYFIFTDEEEPQAKSLLYREAQEMGRMQNYKATSVSNFTGNMKDPSHVSDKFRYTEDDILKSFSRCFTSATCDINDFSKQFYYWLDIIEDMKAHYNQIEAKHIAGCLKQVLIQFKHISLNDEETIAVEILAEELNNKGII